MGQIFKRNILVFNLDPAAESFKYRCDIGKISMINKYLFFLINLAKVKKNIKVAWDPGNGSSGEIISRLTKKLNGKQYLINEKIDGNFPAHHPDPTVPENLKQLTKVSKILNEVLNETEGFDTMNGGMYTTDDMNDIVNRKVSDTGGEVNNGDIIIPANAPDNIKNLFGWGF